MLEQRRSLAGEGDEDGLGGVFGEVRFADAAETGRVDPVLVAFDKLGEGRFRTAFDVLAKKRAVVDGWRHLHTVDIQTAGAGGRQKFAKFRRPAADWRWAYRRCYTLGLNGYLHWMG